MEPFIRHTLFNIKDTSDIQTVKPISGGDINQSYYVATREQAYFIKSNEHVSEHFFQVEAEGLKLIQETGAIRVPEVYYYDRPKSGEKAALVMEWIESGPSHSAECFGEHLANMHQHTLEKYGYGNPTFIGELNQPNAWCPTWTEYYSRYRLGSQFKIGVEKGTISSLRKQRLLKLMNKIEQIIPDTPKASLLHGDLWGGNWMAAKDGEAVLIDPSVLYGDHAFELAFTELFGGFPANFLDEYHASFPLPDDYQDIKPVYQLFYLLAHLNMFGEMYGGHVDRILKHYVG
ncbi:Fructosamine-3-kinase [Halobacillus karajensis]|uniref:Fructosamine-3-kinase n=1 Tax=Halobacillus karajensis TaxID=195088 RepID=A0A024P3D5_9BACI|nr:fructosamine kinase family protein [Halobacillus karajensis]CDQ18764.1 Fructosamine-3-kinase [Halobacillus karajensis]CDQ23164.1 Fructosamine-3-kinase [Halobacillus karajensis]CDQ26646.1 Fructosamine-3-kinase [Halobacillus karajensis]SEH46537.1 Fructosamine-3-kinase [Halobacillus karajensis]